MKRRLKASGGPAKTRRRKTVKRRNAVKGRIFGTALYKRERKLRYFLPLQIAE